MQPPTAFELLHDFIGVINCYRDIWPHGLNILAPPSAKTGAPKKGKKHPPFQWTPERG